MMPNSMMRKTGITIANSTAEVAREHLTRDAQEARSALMSCI
jgi:hypothetical protein